MKTIKLSERVLRILFSLAFSIILFFILKDLKDPVHNIALGFCFLITVVVFIGSLIEYVVNKLKIKFEIKD